jgi:aspartokinase-like uncharacterized kinase
MNPSPIRVVKVGGSLLSWAEVSGALQDWLGRQTAMHNVLLAGGGEFADVVRSADERFGLGEVESHWICVELLHATSRLLASLLPDSRLIPQWTELEHLLKKQSTSECLILDPVEFLREHEQLAVGSKHRSNNNCRSYARQSVEIRRLATAATTRSDTYFTNDAKLPHTWETTSDSIAARVAVCLGADELVLLKSVTPKSGENLETLAKLGLVDKFFPHAANMLCNVRIVNLRRPAFDEAAFVCGKFRSRNEKGQVHEELGLDLS